MLLLSAKTYSEYHMYLWKFLNVLIKVKISTIQHRTDGLNAIRQENWTRYKIWNWREKISLFVEDVIFYTENPSDSIYSYNISNHMYLKINLLDCLKLTCEYILKGGNIPLTMFLILREPHIPFIGWVWDR